MLSWWHFLKREDNRAILGWLGGGIMVVAAGGWAVAERVWPEGSGGAGGRVVEAPCGLAVGGDFTGGSATVSPDKGACAGKAP